MFQIAIPTYRRYDIVRRRTLAFLQLNGIPASRITLFVASEEEHSIYSLCINEPYRPKLVIGHLGIHNQRVFMEAHYPPGTPVLFLDDDICRIKSPFTSLSFEEQVGTSFTLAAAEGCRLWGIHPNDHGLSLKDEAIVGLRFCIGSCYGLVVGQENSYPRQLTEDYDRTVQCWRRDGKILRFNGLGPTTYYAATPGGLSAARSHERMALEFGEFCSINNDIATLRERAGKGSDARLKIITEKRIERPFETLATE